MRRTLRLNLFFMIFIIISNIVVAQETIIIQDNLQGSTIGAQVGGAFTGEGYKPGTGENHILYDVPAQIQNGYVEVQVKGFNFNDFPPVNATNQSYETSFLIMYDGRGISEPIVYFFDYRNNYFRWDVTYRSERWESTYGNRWKGKIHIAEDSPERLNSTYAVYPQVPEHTADWGIEPNGIYTYWDPNQWYTIRVEWDNNGKNYRFYRDGELVWASYLDMGVPITDNSPYPVTSPWPWLPVDFKIHLGSGPDRYSSKMPNMVFRNFKVVSTGAIQNTAPVITSTAVTSGSVGQLYSYDVNASGNPAPTYSLTIFPSGMTINSTSGLIQWTPSSTGNFDVTVVASNGISPDAAQSFTINVQSSTTFAPIITSTAVTSGTVGQLYTYDVETDANPNPTYSLTTFPSGMTINSTTGLIQWTPLSAGNFDVTVNASNGVSPDASQSFTINVQSSTTFAPAITSTAVTSGTVGQLYTYDVDTDGNPTPTYSLSTFPSGMTINSTSGLIEWTPSATGDFDVTVNASNGVSPDASQSFTINVQSSTTFAPIITSTAVTSGTVGQLYTYDVETDGNPTPTYSLTTFPSGMTINSTTGLIQWTPTSAGNFDVTVNASNGVSPDATQSFQINVTEALPCPVGIISYWKLDETSGSVYSDYIGTNNATSTSIPTPVAGRVNGAQQFNGTSNRITAPGMPAYDFTTNTSFTFEAWIKHITGFYTGEEIIVERKSSSGALAINLKFNSTAVSFSARNTASEIYDVTGTTNLYDNNWHHVVGVRDANTNQLKIYVDGVLENTVSATYTAGFASPTTEINIGWRSSTSAGFFDGIIDEVAIYDAALDAVSISQHYSNGLQNQGYCNEIQPINVPTNLSAVLNPSDTTNVILSWLNNSDNELGFVIERKTGDSLSIELFAVVDTVGADVTGYEDTSVDDTTTYTYRVYAFNADIVSDYSNMAQVVTPVPVELTSFFATLLNQGVLLEWETASELNNAGFNVQRSKDNSKFFDIAYIKGQGTTTNKSFYSYNDQSVSTGKYSYRLKQIDLDGSVTYSQVVSVDLGMVNSFVLEQNYPNPFNPSTQIRFSIPEVTNVKLIVSDALGREIALLVDGKLNAGDYKIDFDADGISSGIYICILITDTFKQSRKMILMK